MLPQHSPVLRNGPLHRKLARLQARTHRRRQKGALGPVTDTCGSDAAALAARAGALAALGLHVQTAAWHTSHRVDADWVVGHLGSALPAGTLQDQQPGGLADALRTALQGHAEPALTEQVTTTAVIAHRPS